MVVRTDTSEAAIAAQDGVLELLLAQPPARLPGLRQGRRVPAAGQHVRASAAGESRFTEEKRHFEKPLPLVRQIVLDRERCIMCYRCVRFTREIAGDEALDASSSAAPSSEIATFAGRAVRLAVLRQHDRALPGRRADQPPVPLRARPWDIVTDAVGLRALPGRLQHPGRRAQQRGSSAACSRDNLEVDDGWLCDRGRFALRRRSGPTA